MINCDLVNGVLIITGRFPGLSTSELMALSDKVKASTKNSAVIVLAGE